MAYAHSRDADTQRHGSHTLGVAAGNGFDTQWRGVAYESDICVVSNAVSADTIYISKGQRDLYTSATDVLGFKYIFDYAASVGKPCVISFSEGSPYSFSDDVQLFNEVMGKMTGPGRIFVASAGNESLRGAKTYFCKQPAQEREGTFLFDSGERLLVNMLSADEFSLSLQVYNGEQPVTFSMPSRDIIADSDSLIMDTVQVDNTEYVIFWNAFTPTGNFGKKLVYQVYVKGPRYIGHSQPIALVLEGKEAEVEVFKYIGSFGTNDANPELAAGQTSHNVLMPGSSPHAICVGATAYRRGFIDADGKYRSAPYGQNGSWASYSGVGPTPEGYVKPDVVANGTNVYSSGSSYYYEANGTTGLETGYSTYNGRTYPWFADLGTSMAAPVVAGIIALWLEAKPDLTREEIMGVLDRPCRHPDTSLSYPNNSYGYGEIDVYAGLLDILGINTIREVSRQQSAARVGVTDGQLVVSLPSEATSHLRLRIYTTSGRLVADRQLPAHQTIYTIRLPHLPTGIYAAQLDGPSALRGSTLVRIPSPL